MKAVLIYIDTLQLVIPAILHLPIFISKLSTSVKYLQVYATINASEIIEGENRLHVDNTTEFSS